MTHERHFLLCEKEIEYIERAAQLLDVNLFTDAKPRALSLDELRSEMVETNNVTSLAQNYWLNLNENFRH